MNTAEVHETLTSLQQSLRQDLKYCHSKKIDVPLALSAVMCVLIETAEQARIDPRGIADVLDETLYTLGRAERGVEK